ALWRISTLRALLAPGMTPWDFETIGSQISETRRDQLWGVTSTVLHYDHVLEKGKWKPDGLRILREAHLPLPGNGRPAFSEDEFASYREQGEMDAKRSAQRGKALRYFLKGRRREGLRALCGYVRATGPGVSEVALGVAGMIGPVATRGLLAVYVASRLRDCARRERDEMSAKSGDPR
ncbi:MAG TPA: hypothetical protein VKB34_05125, partial [Povalibacter sp.]|nr:hypothetical protein [Povalibacter sp.]